MFSQAKHAQTQHTTGHSNAQYSGPTYIMVSKPKKMVMAMNMSYGNAKWLVGHGLTANNDLTGTLTKGLPLVIAIDRLNAKAAGEEE
jgi:hypothetical protein